ncbi:MAG: PQQ-like beta-propeller repeat protein [Pirellulaceae bacterium]|nr:PQQ-like beta-propeller repeat protein [Pirellulaceae bacterium]
MIGLKNSVCCWLLLGIVATHCQAQFPNRRQNDASEEAFPIAPRPLMRLLREGEIAFKEERWSDGITALSALLWSDDNTLPADLRGQDYFVDHGIAGLLNKSVKGEAIRLLSELPAEGRRTLELQFGVTAQRELATAISEADFERLGSVARKYMHTEAGYDAQVLLAQYKLTSGHPLAAAGLLQNLLGYPAARQRYGAALALATARALRAAGNVDAAGTTLKLAARNFPGESLTIAGQQMPLDAVTDWRSILSRDADKEQPIVDTTAGSAWTMSGGSPERNATSQASMPLPTERWMKKIHSSLPEEEAIERQSQAETQKGRVLLPKFELRMVGDLVLTKTTDASLLAIDFDTGVIKWPLYFHNAPVQLTNLPYAEVGGNAPLSDELQNRIWGSSAFGKFSCDEQRLYLVSQQSDHLLAGESVFKVEDTTRDSNFLEGASLRAQGAILWRVGGSSGVDEPQLSGAYFLGPPLPYQGDLYCVVDIRGETKLVVLDAATGRLRWKQQLVQASNAMPRLDGERNSQALSPTIADGVILCPTGVGAIVAVDLLSRGLRWGAAYATHRSNVNNAFLQRGAFGEGPEFSALERRWQEPGMIAQDGIVAISPPESDEMFCRDILTGAIRLAPQRRNAYRYIAGMRHGRLFAVGERQVVAIDLATGRPAWQRDFPKGLSLAGKGLWQSDSLLIPLSDNQLIRVSTDDGRVLESAQVAQPLGNLFAYKNQLLSVGSSSVTVYYTRDALSEEVAQRLAANANDTWALNQQSQLALVQGDLPQALRSLEASYALDPNSADTRYLLVDLLLNGLVADFPRFEELAHKYAAVVEFGPQRFRFLQQLALGKIRSGQYLDAFERLLSLIPQVGSTFATTQNRQRDITLGRGHQVDSDAWIATELSRAYVAATPTDRRSMQRSIESELSSIENTMVPLRREKLRFLQWLPTANPALIALASSLLGGEEQTIAEQLLLPPLVSGDAKDSQIARELLKLPALADQRFASPNFSASRLANRAGFNDAALLTPENASPDSNHARWPDEWNRGVVRMDASDESRYQFGSKVELVAERYGRPELSVALSASMVVLRTGQGDDRAHFEFPGASSDASTDAITRATIRGGLLLIEKSSEVAAFDIHRDMTSRVDAMLWRHSLFNPGAGPSVPFSIPEVSTDNTRLGFTLTHRQMPGKQQALVGPLTPSGLVLQVGTRVILLDALTGRQIWSREGYDDRVRLAGQGLEVAIVNPSLGVVQVVDCRDGTELRTREFRGDWKPWFSHNGMLVDFSESQIVPPPPTTLRVWNALTGEEALRLEVPLGGCAQVCEGRYLVVLEPNSYLHYCDLNDPQHILVKRHAIKTDLNVESIAVQRFENRLVVLPNSGIARTALDDMLPVSGDVYTLDTETGELLWDKPGRLINMQFPKSQPRESPFMFVFRMQPQEIGEHHAAVALIDLRSGRLAYSNPDLPLRASMGFAMSLRPERQTIDIGLGARSLRFTLTDQTPPPRPVFRFGGSAQSQRSAIEDGFGDSLFGR